MKAEIVSIGTEILLGQIVDTNAAELGRLFARVGFGHTHRQTVGDNLGRVVEALRVALSRADVVVTIGGLGPTQDDLTRDAVAEALGDVLVEDEGARRRLEVIFRNRKMSMTESQFSQAMRPSCGRTIENPNGTAPGIVCQKDGKTVICLPGPRNEFVPMVEGEVFRVLRELGDGTVIFSRVLRLAGIGEAKLEEELVDLLNLSEVTVAPYAKIGEVHLRLTARAGSDEEAGWMIEPVAREIYRRVGSFVYAEGEDDLAVVALGILKDRGETLGVAESCTGGMLGAALTAVDGSSAVFAGGFLTYDARLKRDLVGVREETLSEYGTVSFETAVEMADGVRDRLGVDWGVSVTGVAGAEALVEGGGEKASGLVYVGVSGEGRSEAREFKLRGSRETIRGRAVSFGLAYLLERLRG